MCRMCLKGIESMLVVRKFAIVREKLNVGFVCNILISLVCKRFNCNEFARFGFIAL
jgi:hypothetical protein